MCAAWTLVAAMDAASALVTVLRSDRRQYLPSPCHPWNVVRWHRLAKRRSRDRMSVLASPMDHPSTLPSSDQLTLIKKIRSVNVGERAAVFQFETPYFAFLANSCRQCNGSLNSRSYLAREEEAVRIIEVENGAPRHFSRSQTCRLRGAIHGPTCVFSRKNLRAISDVDHIAN